ncbi:MAG: HAD family hydrolase [Candidatus Nanohaloarchaea archaeon]
MGYDAAVFDMDGVILNSFVESEEWKFEAVRSALRNEGADPDGLERDELREILGDKGYKACVKKAMEVGVNPRDIWTEVAERTVSARKRQLENGDFQLYDGVRETLESIHREVEMALISNAPDEAVMLTVDHFDLKEYFEFYLGIRNFEDLQARKPHPNHLEVAKAEINKESPLYVGDAESDIIAAHRADMDAVWVNRDGVNPEKLDVSPEYEVREISEILEIIKTGQDAA